jgi:hypothetical protein
MMEEQKKSDDLKSSEKPSQFKPSPQPLEKKARPRRVTALRTCTVQLDDCTVDLVEGEVVQGLESQELAHLVFHGFVI